MRESKFIYSNRYFPLGITNVYDSFLFQPGMIQISCITAESIPRDMYTVIPRGRVKVKVYSIKIYKMNIHG